MSLIKKIKEFYDREQKNLLFTTPSHSQGDFIAPEAKNLLGEKFYNCDFSEIEGFDNLRNPRGAIKDIQDFISTCVNSKESFILTNGSTSGIIAIIMAVLKEGDKVLVARNCHVSVYNALVLCGAVPVWFLPEYDENWGLFKGVKAQDIEPYLKNDSKIKSVIITSPTYEGLYSNVEEISELTKKYSATLIVDEAHGALTQFAPKDVFKAKSAIDSGADSSVQSLHKTAGAPNPCALLHISKNSNITKAQVQNALNLINTTSPSYPLMSAIEATVRYLASQDGQNHIKELVDSIEALKQANSGKFEYYDGFNDPTKLVLRIKNTNSSAVAQWLNDDCGIEEEFSTERFLLFITGIGTTYDKLQKLFLALNKFDTNPAEKQDFEHSRLDYAIPEMKFTPRDAYFKNKISCKAKDSAEKICGEVVMNYPPGIPVLIPGEVITEKNLELINNKEILIIDPND